MKSSDKLIKRIFFLQGLPNLQDLGRLYIGENVTEILSGNIKFEGELRAMLLDAIAHCEKESDYISREVLETVLTESEEQIDWIETQEYLIKESGLENYLQSAM
jgi:bacterioferritin